jgi:hypothetical protein
MYEVLPEQKVSEIAVLFQQQEQELFGANGLDEVLEAVTRLEAELQIQALEGFTPKDL